MLNRLFGFWRPQLAVDLGTSNTLISAPGRGLLLSEPSVVALDRKTGRVLSGGCAVGHLAKQMLGRAPDSIRVVRPLSEGVIADYRLCEAMLRYLLRKALKDRWVPKPRLVVAIPGCITPVQRQAVLNSCLRAGAGQVFLLPEVKAAAIGCGLPINEPVASMICDVGGGTTEVAIMSLAEEVSARSIRVGGDAMDEAIVHYLRKCYSLEIGLQAAERLRIEIGSAFPLDDERTDEVRGVDVVSGLPRQATITSEEIREALEEPLDAIAFAIKAALDSCGPDLAGDLVDRGLVLAGGASLLRGMDRYLAEQTGLPVRVSPDALTAVAKGAEICLEQFTHWRPAFTSVDDAA